MTQYNKPKECVLFSKRDRNDVEYFSVSMTLPDGSKWSELVFLDKKWEEGLKKPKYRGIMKQQVVQQQPVQQQQQAAQAQQIAQQTQFFNDPINQEEDVDF